MTSTKPYYDAEHEVRFMLTNGGTVELFGSKLVVPEERKFGTVDGVQRYVTHVCEWLDLGPAPVVKGKRSRTTAHYSLGEIHVPEHVGVSHSWAMREIVVLHELAHHLAIGNEHGPRWAGAFLMLIEKCIGPEASFMMMAAFGERGVQITPYRVK